VFLVAGLGNPGEEYADTPHNLGFLAVEQLAQERGVSVKALMAKHEIAPGRLILVYDELDLPWGEVRIRPNGRPRGHNGVRSVVEQLGTEEFIRVRLGANPGHPLKSGADYLLSQFTRGQKKELEEALGAAARAVNSIIADGVEMSMAKFNRRAGGLIQEDR
jgi:PTH1 family peptidyl-tRNA hydrolase